MQSSYFFTREVIMRILKLKPMLAVCSAIAVCIFFFAAAAKEKDFGSGSKTAFLVIDIQNDYFDGGKYPLVNSVKAAEHAKKALAYFRKNGTRIIHIRHENTGANAPFFIPGTDGAKIHQSVSPIGKETVILKHKPDSFIGTPLEDELKKDGITRLIISGMQSNVCVQATALSAVAKNYEVTVLEDCIAAKSGELHLGAVSKMKESGVTVTAFTALSGK
jgi:nicotinamidase-related amidase